MTMTQEPLQRMLCGLSQSSSPSNVERRRLAEKNAPSASSSSGYVVPQYPPPTAPTPHCYKIPTGNAEVRSCNNQSLWVPCFRGP
jgi:hypothetical protein